LETSGAFKLRPKFGDGWRRGGSVVIAVLEQELRFLTGDG
jgi:hypothetical protein